MLPESVRIKFSKTGVLKFISHLDLCRTFSSAVLRAKIPIWYTEGFNPHPKMVFSLPLSVGTESVCEYMDIKITSPMPFDEIVSRLNSALTPDIKILEAFTPKMKFREIAYSAYEITPGEKYDLSPLKADTVVITKRTKTKEVEIDVKDRIKELTEKDKKIYMTLSAGSDDFIKADSLMALTGCEDYSILRTQIYTKDMKIFR